MRASSQPCTDQLIKEQVVVMASSKPCIEFTASEIAHEATHAHTHLDVRQVYELGLGDGLVGLPEHALLEQQAALPALLCHLGVAELAQHIRDVPGARGGGRRSLQDEDELIWVQG